MSVYFYGTTNITHLESCCEKDLEEEPPSINQPPPCCPKCHGSFSGRGLGAAGISGLRKRTKNLTRRIPKYKLLQLVRKWWPISWEMHFMWLPVFDWLTSLQTEPRISRSFFFFSTTVPEMVSHDCFNCPKAPVTVPNTNYSMSFISFCHPKTTQQLERIEWNDGGRDYTSCKNLPNKCHNWKTKHVFISERENWMRVITGLEEEVPQNRFTVMEKSWIYLAFKSVVLDDSIKSVMGTQISV